MLSAAARPRRRSERGQLKTLETEPKTASASTATGSESSATTTLPSRTSKQPSWIGPTAALSMTGILRSARAGDHSQFPAAGEHAVRSCSLPGSASAPARIRMPGE